ncbi:hypothetical protein [Streptomyces resistomycificus]|uniref:Lipoprotein n=1 Tax=Streptomyces resistomycificus TaxID=67356 RepID=A0A0L8KTU6_9ACTN|nr:hypothetical protein [Streptomyces resistomycificus]KOG29378.1 lipoprotein [Streptomyces resistomycificus]KUO01720.1 hypothetical protein AQJ84_04635 [Streptomyces resistomycificus]
MTARPTRPVRFVTSALAAGALLTTAACSDDGGSGAAASDVTASPVAEQSRAARPPAAKTPTPSPSGALTAAGARAALLTEADLEDDWTQVGDKQAASWRESLLVGTVDVAEFLTAKTDADDCQKLLDTLYSDDLLGKPSGAGALRGFAQGDSRLLQQVAAYDKVALDESLAWMQTLPTECDQFTATDDTGDERTVQVIKTSVPNVGDARQGLRVTVRGPAGDTPATLTLDVAVVRVGTDAITVTAGGLDGDESDSVEQAVRIGTERLKDVQAGRTPSADPGEVD